MKRKTPLTNSNYSKSLLITVLFLISMGLIQVYSSSYIFAIEKYGDGLFFFKKQAFFAILGLSVFIVASILPLKFLKGVGYLSLGVSVVGIFLTLIPGIGVTVGGASRWLSLPYGFRFEPSELLKYSSAFFLAYMIQLYFSSKLSEKQFLMKSLILLVPIGLLLKQPDFGSFAIALSVIFLLLVIYGMNWRYIATFAGAGLFSFYFLILNVPYRRARIEAFLDPWANQSQSGFQVIQSLLSFYSGGFWGEGLGLGQSKLFFLPEAHTDFTLAVLGEELGFLGVSFILLLYLFIFFKGLQISLNSRTFYTQALTLTVTLVFTISVLINVGVSLGVLPPKGLALPFLSYGGSSLVCTCFALGILANIDRLNLGYKKRFKGLKIN